MAKPATSPNLPTEKSSLFWSVVFPSLAVWGIMMLGVVLFLFDIPLFQYITTTNIQTAPFGNDIIGQLGFSGFYLGISILMLFALGLVVRKKLLEKRWKILSFTFGIVTLLLAFNVFWYLSRFEILLLVGGTWTVFTISISEAEKVTNTHRLIRLPFILLAVATAGITFVLVLPFYTVLALPIIYSIWDIVAVFKGPMIKVAKGLPSKIQPLFMMKLGARTIGFGDLIFYILLACIGLTFSIDSGAFAMAGIVGGVYYTLYLLREGKHQALPGLPLPILFGYIGIFLGMYL